MSGWRGIGGMRPAQVRAQIAVEGWYEEEWRRDSRTNAGEILSVGVAAEIGTLLLPELERAYDPISWE